MTVVAHWVCHGSTPSVTAMATRATVSFSVFLKAKKGIVTILTNSWSGTAGSQNGRVKSDYIFISIIKERKVLNVHDSNKEQND